jgi:DNA-binding NtrC family response regulator
LRERVDDIPILLNYFVDMASQEFGRDRPHCPPELVTLLQRYDFPGNVRELKSMVFDAVGRYRSKMLSVESFLGAMQGCPSAAPPPTHASSSSIKPWFDQLERFPTLKETVAVLIEQALAKSKGNQRVAALMLGITPQALSQRLKKRS